MERERRTSKEAELLINKLAGIGLATDAVKQQLQQILNLDIPAFTLQTDLNFSQDKVHFEVRVEKSSPDAGGFDIKEIIAILRDVIAFPLNKIDGIDIVALDQKMAGLDWQGWYNNIHKTHPDDKGISEVMDLMTRLYKKEGTKVRQTVQMLMYKHWPREMFMVYGSKEALQWIERRQKKISFDMEQWPGLTAALAWLVLTGRDVVLADKVHNVLHDFKTFVQVQKELYPFISKYPESFQLAGRENNPDRFLDYKIPIAVQDGEYVLGPYSLALKKYPEVLQGDLDGIDFRKLDTEMQALKWNDEGQVLTTPGDPSSEFTERVARIEADLYVLSKDPVAFEVSDLLRLKYHQKVPILEGMIQQTAWDRLEELPGLTAILPADISLKQAASLLEGRDVYCPILHPGQAPEARWARLWHLEEPPGIPPQLIYTKGPTRQEIENMLEMLLVQNSFHLGYQKMLMDGQRITVRNGLDIPLQVQVDAQSRSLAVFSGEGLPIPFNFLLDPYFKASIGQTLAEQPMKNDKNDKRKAKGLGR